MPEGHPRHHRPGRSGVLLRPTQPQPEPGDQILRGPQNRYLCDPPDRGRDHGQRQKSPSVPSAHDGRPAVQPVPRIPFLQTPLRHRPVPGGPGALCAHYGRRGRGHQND